MKAGTMEGLIGAGINMKLMDTPMRVYKEARRKGDLGAMERAMGYATEFQDTAYEYKEKAEKELRKEMQENREEQQREREEALEERREAAKETQKETAEKLAEKSAEKKPIEKTDGIYDGSDATSENTKTLQADRLTISEEGHKLLQSNRPAPDIGLPDLDAPNIEAPDIPSNTDSKSEVKFYSSAGTTVEAPPVGRNVSVNV